MSSSEREETVDETKETSISSSSIISTQPKFTLQLEELNLCDNDDDEEIDSNTDELEPFISPKKNEVYTIHDLTTSSGMSKVKGWRRLFVRALNCFCFQKDSYVDYIVRPCNSKAIQTEMKNIYDLLFNLEDWRALITNEEASYIKSMRECEEKLFAEYAKYRYNFDQGLPTAQILNEIETLFKCRQIQFYHLSRYIRPLRVLMENYRTKISENIINASFVRTAEGATKASRDAETLKKCLLDAKEKYQIEKPTKIVNEEDIDTTSFVTDFLTTGKMKDEIKFYK